jgi:hypothetical protein
MAAARMTKMRSPEAAIGAALLILLSQSTVANDDKTQTALNTAKQDVKKAEEVVVRDAKAVGETVKRDARAAAQAVKKDAKAVETTVVQDAEKAKAALKHDK